MSFKVLITTKSNTSGMIGSIATTIADFELKADAEAAAKIINNKTNHSNLYWQFALCLF